MIFSGQERPDLLDFFPKSLVQPKVVDPAGAKEPCGGMVKEP